MTGVFAFASIDAFRAGDIPELVVGTGELLALLVVLLVAVLVEVAVEAPSAEGEFSRSLETSSFSVSTTFSVSTSLSNAASLCTADDSVSDTSMIDVKSGSAPSLWASVVTLEFELTTPASSHTWVDGVVVDVPVATTSEEECVLLVALVSVFTISPLELVVSETAASLLSKTSR